MEEELGVVGVECRRVFRRVDLAATWISSTRLGVAGAKRPWRSQSGLLTTWWTPLRSTPGPPPSAKHHVGVLRPGLVDAGEDGARRQRASFPPAMATRVPSSRCARGFIGPSSPVMKSQVVDVGGGEVPGLAGVAAAARAPDVAGLGAVGVGKRRRASGHDDDDGLASRQAGAPAGGAIAISRPAAWATFLNQEALRSKRWRAMMRRHAVPTNAVADANRGGQGEMAPPGGGRDCRRGGDACCGRQRRPALSEGGDGCRTARQRPRSPTSTVRAPLSTELYACGRGRGWRALPIGRRFRDSARSRTRAGL